MIFKEKKLKEHTFWYKKVVIAENISDAIKLLPTVSFSEENMVSNDIPVKNIIVNGFVSK